MPGQAAKITITERQHDILFTLRNAVTAPSHLRRRASVILLAFNGLRNEDIAEEVGLGRRQVGRWRRRWAKAWNRLVDIECCETKADLRRTIEAVLTDEPRPGAPAKFSPEQVTQILAVACEPPEKSGLPITHWTAHELAAEVVKRGIVASISTTQVGRYLPRGRPRAVSQCWLIRIPESFYPIFRGGRLESWWNLCTQERNRHRVEEKPAPGTGVHPCRRTPLPPEKQAEIEDLAEAIREAVDAEISELAAQPRHHRRRPPLRRQRVQDPRPRPQDRRQGRRAAPGGKKNGYDGACVTLPALRPSRRVPFAPRAHAPAASSGPIRYRRAYYLCRRCGKGLFPFDQRGGADDPAPDTGPGAGRRPGRGGRRQLREGGRTARGDGRRAALGVDRRADHRGRRPAPGRRRAGRRGPSVPRPTGPGTRTTRGRRCAYVELDATGVRQQAPGGGPPRAAWPTWGWSATPARSGPGPTRKPRPMQARYLSGLYPLEDFAPLLRAARRARGHGPGRPLDRAVRRRQRPGGPPAGELPARGGDHPGLLSPGGEAHRTGAAAVPRGRGAGRGASPAVATAAQGRRGRGPGGRPERVGVAAAAGPARGGRRS